MLQPFETFIDLNFTYDHEIPFVAFARPLNHQIGALTISVDDKKGIGRIAGIKNQTIIDYNFIKKHNLLINLFRFRLQFLKADRNGIFQYRLP